MPATVTLELEPAAMTRVSVNAPCHAGEVAELAYEGLRFALPLDAQGAGSLAVPGFRGASEAMLGLGGREAREFTIPFREIERIDRVAVVWETPDAAEAPGAPALHAFEFGARPGTPGHVSPAEPRSFETVRRTGGGWLAAYEPAHGKGRRIEVYSFWRRFGGPSGVVRLGLDPAAGAGDCAGAAAGAADYRVLRMTGGRLERPRLGRIAPRDCTVLAGAGGPEGARDPGRSAGRSSGRFIDAAVDDLVVRRR
ncbi:MAG TPA: hypothetical protein VMM59_11355 [Thermohalobaculum sp.]|nr:hypothetical protein [Thermohalobaculum sp.]